MQKYKWLLRKQEKAIAIFRQAGDQLQAVKNHIMSELSDNQLEIDNLHVEIVSLIDANDFLEKQHDAVHEQHQKIIAIVGDA